MLQTSRIVMENLKHWKFERDTTGPGNQQGFQIEGKACQLRCIVWYQLGGQLLCHVLNEDIKGIRPTEESKDGGHKNPRQVTEAINRSLNQDMLPNPRLIVQGPLQ